MNKTEMNEELTAEMFNISQEFEDIQFVIDDLSGDAVMEVSSRRC